MPLSGLQKYILKTCYRQKRVLVKGKFEKFYLRAEVLTKGGQFAKIIPSKTEQIKIISRSLERLINKGYAVGYGEKTQYKWFIKEIKLTALGRKLSKKLQGEQTRFLFKK